MQQKLIGVYNFRKHLLAHQPVEYKPLSSYFIKGLSYQCKLCSRLMLCDNVIIKNLKNHMRDVHGQKIVDKNSEASKRRRLYKTKHDTFFKATVVYSSSIFKKPEISISQIPLIERTSKIGNLCKFSCLKCDSKDFESFNLLKRHCKAKHNSGVSYNESLVSEARCHSCLLCPKGVLSDRYFLAHHLLYRHKKGLPEYERVFRQNDGEVLPTYHN